MHRLNSITGLLLVNHTLYELHTVPPNKRHDSCISRAEARRGFAGWISGTSSSSSPVDEATSRLTTNDKKRSLLIYKFKRLFTFVKNELHMRVVRVNWPNIVCVCRGALCVTHTHIECVYTRTLTCKKTWSKHSEQHRHTAQPLCIPSSVANTAYS